MRPDEFWELTWYDFGMWCLKLWRDAQKVKAEREWSDERLRHMMALYWNGVSGKPKGPKDFFKIVDERKPDPTNVPDDAAVMAEMKRQFGSKVKRKKRG